MERQQLLNTLRLTYDNDLPIVQRRTEIADLIWDNQVIVVCGETGSGKSTQLPKICLEIGRGTDGTIGHTQPRDVQEQFLFKLDNRSKIGKSDHALLFSGKVPKVAPVPI